MSNPSKETTTTTKNRAAVQIDENGDSQAVVESQNVNKSPPPLPESIDKEQLERIKKALMMIQLQSGQDASNMMINGATSSSVKSVEEAQSHNYQFWSTQPVPKLSESIDSSQNCAIQSNIENFREEVRKEPYTLPDGFMWDSLNIKDPLIIKELYTLLYENYVEDTDQMFRFDYSIPFLNWVLQPPSCIPSWRCGVRVRKSGKLMAFISAIPVTIKVFEKVVSMVEINFLCVHKKLRCKRLAPVLIREITRRSNIEGYFQAVFTAGVVLPRPISTCRYWHRSLNPKKLIEVKFSQLSRNMTMQRHIKLYRLPEKTSTHGLRKLTKNDVTQACKLLNDYLAKFDLTCHFTETEFAHWFLPRDHVVECYVVESTKTAESQDDIKSCQKNVLASDEKNSQKMSQKSSKNGQIGVITDMISFYSLPSSIMNNKQYTTLNAAYSFYNVANTVSWTKLMTDALVLAKQLNYDVFNALDLMDNSTFLSELKFGIGDGDLQYYLYNWKCPTMAPNKVGIVLQ